MDQKELDPIDKQMLLEELWETYDGYQLRPKVTNYVLSQGCRQANGKGFWFRVKPKSGLDFSKEENAQLIDETTVYTS